MPYGTVNVDSVVNSDGVTSGGLYGFKNRVINGAMVINQRNTTVTADLQYTVDRFRFGKSNDAVESVAQSTDAPAGFTYSLKNTIGTADTSIGATQYSNFKHAIEGYNVADLAFGTASAKPVTISFWVKSSVAGLYTGNICNSAENRICPFTYTVNAANTWEQKTYTFQGDTSGTWLTDNGIGLSIYFYMALGSTYYNGTAGTWGAAPNYGAGGASLVNVLGTVGNTFAITGVQLEKGSTATSFDYRPYGTEFLLCQRYYWDMPAVLEAFSGFIASSAVGCDFYVRYPVAMRTTPSISYTSLGNYAFYLWNSSVLKSATAITLIYASSQKGVLGCTWSGASGVAGTGASMDITGGDVLRFSAEL